MPSEGVDADCVCIDPALTRDRDWLFPPNLDSGAPRAGARLPGMTGVWNGVGEGQALAEGCLTAPSLIPFASH